MSPLGHDLQYIAGGSDARSCGLIPSSEKHALLSFENFAGSLNHSRCGCGTARSTTRMTLPRCSLVGISRNSPYFTFSARDDLCTSSSIEARGRNILDPIPTPPSCIAWFLLLTTIASLIHFSFVFCFVNRRG